jgi:hypothetical protein
MPTILFISGWRIYFWANEGNEPIHVHAEKSDMECKYWMDVDKFEITEALSFNMTPQATREVKRIIYEHFDYIVIEWNRFFKENG